jgi:ADP-ribosylglycohydrolase
MDKIEKIYKTLDDIVGQAGMDVRDALDSSVEAAKAAAGITGMYGLMQKITSQMMVGCGMLFAAMRDSKHGTATDDDLLWACLMAYEAERKDAHEDGFEERVQQMFKSITGRYHKIPEWWRQVH